MSGSFGIVGDGNKLFDCSCNRLLPQLVPPMCGQCWGAMGHRVTRRVVMVGISGKR